MDRGSWRTIVHGVSKSRARLSDFHIYIYICIYTYSYCCSVTQLYLTQCDPMGCSTVCVYIFFYMYMCIYMSVYICVCVWREYIHIYRSHIHMHIITQAHTH